MYVHKYMYVCIMYIRMYIYIYYIYIYNFTDPLKHLNILLTLVVDVVGKI